MKLGGGQVKYMVTPPTSPFTKNSVRQDRSNEIQPRSSAKMAVIARIGVLKRSVTVYPRCHSL